jgi:predicted MPP superfamily phosphohydrolase
MAGIILHLSDIHIKTGKESILERVAEIASAAIGQTPNPDFTILLVTGDLTFGGSKDEFIIAHKMIEDIKTELLQRMPKSKGNTISVVMIPGNHDCDFDSDTELRRSAIDRLRTSKKYEKSLFEEAIKVNESYFKLIKDVLGRDLRDKEKLVYQQEITENGNRIVFNCINTAWISQKKQNAGALGWPVEEIDAILLPNLEQKDVKNTTFISILHHPYNWFIPEVGRSLRRKLELYSDIIFTGHEHDHETYTRISDDRTSITYIEGDVLSDSDDKDISGFNIIEIDFTARKRISRNYQWDVTSKTYQINKHEQTSWILFNRMAVDFCTF